MFKINDEFTCFDTTLLDWSPAHVVEVAHQQASAEACFRQMNDLDNCTFQLDQEQADGAVEAVDVNLLVGPVADRAPRWDAVQECLVVPALRSADERPRLEVTLNVIDDTGRRRWRGGM